ncbi:component of the polarisome [Phlyctochytrium bullatum]|nr:component of the polarisome [Phlyctochytrium bullatum]
MPTKTGAGGSTAAAPGGGSSSGGWLKNTSKLFSFLTGSRSSNASSAADDSHHKGRGAASSSRNSMGGRSKSHPGNVFGAPSAQQPVNATNAQPAKNDKKKRSKDAGKPIATPALPMQTPQPAASTSSALRAGAPAPPPPSDTLNPYHKRSDSPSRAAANGGSSYLSAPGSHHRPISPAPSSDRSGHPTPATPAHHHHFHSLDRMSPPHSRSASPAPSVSSTLAAERLARLTDAQVADLAAQVSAESFRRRTPVGALIAAYELSVSGPGLSAASRLSMMSNEQFRVLANDLDAEALRRDIPGIDTLGRSRAGSVPMIRTVTGGSLSESMLSRELSVLRAKFGPNNPAAAEAMEAAAASGTLLAGSTGSPSTGGSMSASPIAAATLSSSPTSPSFLGNGIPMAVTASMQSVTPTGTLERSISASPLPTRLIPVGAGPAAATTLASSIPRSLSATNISALSGSLASANPLTSSATTLATPSLAPHSAPLLANSPAGSVHPDLAMVEEDPDRTIWRSRLGSLADGQFGALRRDVRAEMDRRKALRRGIMVPNAPSETEDDDAAAEDGAPAAAGALGAGGLSRKSTRGTTHSGGGGAETPAAAPAGGTAGDHDSGFAASVIAAVNERTNASLPNTPGSSRPNSDEPQQAATPPKPAPVSLQTRPSLSSAGVSPAPARLEELMRALPSQDLWQLWEDTEAETARRAAGGLVVAGVSAAEAAAAAEQERQAQAAAAAKEKEREKRKKEKAAEKEGKEAKEAREAREAANVTAWRSRIAKLTDEQMAEVTADVYDEMTRRRDKSAPFLPPRADLSPKRNEARKELSKLPSRELKMLWSIIHDSMKKRKMVT